MRCRNGCRYGCSRACYTDEQWAEGEAYRAAEQEHMEAAAASRRAHADKMGYTAALAAQGASFMAEMQARGINAMPRPPLAQQLETAALMRETRATMRYQRALFDGHNPTVRKGQRRAAPVYGNYSQSTRDFTWGT